jgi:O-antigen ligase
MIYTLIWINYNKKHKILSSIVFVVFFYFSFYFQCRSAIVGELFFVFLILSEVILKYKLFSKIFIYSTNILATVLPFLFVFMWNKSIYFTIPLLNKQNIYTGRERVWAHFLELFRESPLFGIGEGSIPIPLIDYKSYTPHNFMFNILVVYGIIVFFAIFSILIYVFTEKMENKNKNTIFFITYNGLIGIMFTSMFEIIPISYIHVIMIWFLLVVLNSVNDTEVSSYGVNIK